MASIFYLIFIYLFLSVYFLYYFVSEAFIYALVFLVPVFLMGVYDCFQRKHGVKRNFPLLGRFRYFFEMIRPELQQYFVESNLSGKPIPRKYRSLIYQRAKRQKDAIAFGTQEDFDLPLTDWTLHSLKHKKIEVKNLNVLIGNFQCQKKYKASLLNISALSYGSLSANAIKALNLGAKKGSFYHNTGEGGISPYHLLGGDLVWQIGTAYFGCRDSKAQFCPKLFEKQALLENVKMIEIKLSQGAKPNKGGFLPGVKVSKEIAKIRKVPLHKDIVSPSYHSAFSDPSSMLDFVSLLRKLSKGKPIGIKFCLGHKKDFLDLLSAMIEKNVFLDFITLDGSEGGTGAAPLEFADSLGSPLNEALAFVDESLKEKKLREHIKIIASGKVFSAFDMICKFSLGADLINSGRGMMLSLGCIHALKCHTNSCPVGVATTKNHLMWGLHVKDKSERVFNFHQNTLKSLASFLGSMNCDLKDLNPSLIFRRTYSGEIKTYKDIYY